MILQALHQLAQDEELMGDPDFEMKPVAWLVRVDENGKLLGIEGTHQQQQTAAGAKKTRAVAKSFLLPREAGRTSGARAFFLFDKAEYVFGIDPEGKRDPEKLSARAALFRERARECFAATNDEGVGAVMRFLDDVVSNRQAIDLPESCTSNDASRHERRVATLDGHRDRGP